MVEQIMLIFIITLKLQFGAPIICSKTI